MTNSDLASRFEKEFQTKPEIFTAPGRVNLIGEHTDYNDGFVLPCAIGLYTYIAVSPRADRKLVLRSTQFDEKFEFELERLPPRRLSSWCDYIVGVAAILEGSGFKCRGANLLVRGEVPIGAGLSSSASVEIATALALLSVSADSPPIAELPRLCQRAENEFVGARVGIMDQFVSCFGRKDHALLLDCRSLDFDLVPIPQHVKLVVCNTMVKHEISGGEYNIRREQCEEGVRILAKFVPGIRALRDVSVDDLNKHAADLSAVVFKRCLHVVEENGRTQETADCFRCGDLNAVGNLMRDSHRSLRDLYEVSCPELDLMVSAAEGLPGFYGGRMTGGGFGGCTVNLVEAGEAKAFKLEIARRYQRETRLSPEIYVCSAADGAAQETDELVK
jgi:galactokinase